MDEISFKKNFNEEKKLNNINFKCAEKGKQKYFKGNSIVNKNNKFIVYQNRKGRKNKNSLTYLLFHQNNDMMIRVDVNGKPHKGMKTPHIHIKLNNSVKTFNLNTNLNFKHINGICELLNNFLKYCNNMNLNSYNDIYESLCEFLSKCYFIDISPFQEELI